MKPLSLLAFALLFLLPTIQAAPPDDEVQAQVSGFYRWYVHALNQNASAEPMKSPQIHRFVSTRFLREVAKQAKSSDMDGGGLDSDPFLLAQDWDKGWENNIKVTSGRREGDKEVVQVVLSGKEMAAHRLKLVLVQESGTWKIDRVSDGDTR